MRCAAVDVGSNTIRMLIAAFHDSRLSRIHTARAITRLAEGIRETGRLRKENIARSLAVLRDFSHSINIHGVNRVRAVGTSAIREAGNSNEFIDAAFRETGIKIEPISGIREARLTTKGVLLGFHENPSPSLIVDIGGGSTEWIIYRAEQPEPLFCGTTTAGVVNLLERFMKTDPPQMTEVSAMQKEIDLLLSSLKNETAKYALPTHIVGTGGTITTLASIDLSLSEYDSEMIHMHNISVDRLKELRDMLLSLTLDKRKDIAGLEPGRADLIIPGILLTIRIMEIFGFKKLTVSDYGILEGLLWEIRDEEGI